MHFSRGQLEFFQGTSRVFAVLVCVLGFVLSSSADTVTATRLDGATLSGDLRSWDGSQLVIATSTGDQHLATSELLSISWSAPSAPAVQESSLPGVVELRDGSEIPFANVEVKESALSASRRSATLYTPLSSASKDTPLESVVPTNLISLIRFKPVGGDLGKQWSEIRTLKPAGDLLVVAKRDGTSLDYVEGAVGEITNDKVEFKLDGDLNRVDRAKVTGIVYSHATDSSTAKTNVVLHGRSGLRLNAATIELAGEFVHVKTAGGESLPWPVDDLESADFSFGKLMYLSDMEPASQNWSPLVGLPAGVTLAAQYGMPRRNHSAFGDELTLNLKDKDDPSSQTGSIKSFSKGLALRSHTELVYRLPEGFNRFTSVAGIDPATASTGNVHLIILADDHPLLETDVAGNQPPLPIDVAISNAKRLKIVVDFGQNLDTGDWLNLCDAKIVK